MSIKKHLNLVLLSAECENWIVINILQKTKKYAIWFSGPWVILNVIIILFLWKF